MTCQQMLDFTFENLWQQNERSYDENIGCVYRGPKGTRCAIGQLIPDEKYNKKMETNLVSALYIKYPELGFKKEDMEFLMSLQDAHDRCSDLDFRDDLMCNYIRVANHFNLNTGELFYYWNNRSKK